MAKIFSSSKVSSKRKPLAPERELRLVDIYLEQGHRASKGGERDIALILCEEAEASLSKMKSCMKTAEVKDDTDLRRDIACAFFNLSKLLEELNERDRAKEIGNKAHGWGYTEVEIEELAVKPSPYSETTVSIANHLGFEVLDSTADQPSRKTTDATELLPMTTGSSEDRPSSKSVYSVANKPAPCRSATNDVDMTVDGDFFTQDRTPPIMESKLPEPDERLVNTHQLVYCLGLLKAPPSSDDPHQNHALQWVKATRVNQDEQGRLNTLTMKIASLFIKDALKDPADIAEVACIGPFLPKETFRTLLEQFVKSIDESNLLNVSTLEALAKLVQGANKDYLMADDLVRILQVLNTRMQTIHEQSLDYIYHLMWAVSRVLDAMADCKVEGLDRVTLHEQLSVYINKYKSNNDPHMVFLAAYTFQALECVPDNESPWQATRRRTGTVMQGVFSIVKAVKGLDVNSFLEGVKSIEAGMEGVFKTIQTVQEGYDNVSALIESGQSLFKALKEGLSFERKRSWYSALRGLDRVLQDGQLSKFRTLVLEAPCQRSLAFQWGVCQRLGDLAANPAWDPESCEDALEFLEEIYQNDATWGYHAHVKQRILDILLQLQHTPENAIQAFDSATAEKVLQRLKHNGDLGKQTLYRNCLAKGASQYPLKISQPRFAALSLLDRVQNKPDVEEDLRKLRQRRMKELEEAVYIPPQAKANLKASDNALFDLTKKVGEFLSSNDQKVLLLLGDSGSGKSTFNRQIEHDLWQKYEKANGRIPLFINLSAIDRPDQDMIVKQLRKYELSHSQIRELKTYRHFVLICDGYDESQEKHNLYMTNCLNQTGEWKVQMVVSCRSEYIGLDYHDHFRPSDDITQFQEAVVAPFSKAQIKDYVAKYVIAKTPLWTTEQYTDVLDQTPSLQELVKNPFLLTLSLEVLPRLVEPGNNLKATKVHRVTLYDEFVVLWLERGKKRLGNKDMDRQERADFDRLTEEGFTQNGISFLKNLAKEIYKNQAGNPMVTYSRKRDQDTWKEAFFSRENENQLLLEASPLTRSGIQYRFIHKSLLEYFFARSVFEPQEGTGKAVQAAAPTRRGSVSSNFSFDDQLVPEEEQEPATTQLSAVDHPLSWRSFVAEPSILDFLSDRVQQESLFKEQLLAIIEQSKVNKEMRKAAANAITILVRAGVSFLGADLRGIQIPNADLSGGQFDSTQLQGADLRKTNLRKIWLHRADLTNAQMAGVRFGEWPYLDEEDDVGGCVYSPDGKTFAVGLHNCTISLYQTATWEKTHTLSGHTNKVSSVVFSPSGQQIASGSYDKTVRLWDAETGAPGAILEGHTGEVNCVVFSPSGQQIASGSDDKAVRLWDARTGAPGAILKGHSRYVMSVVFSPSGQQIASGSLDKTVRLWDAETGAPGAILEGHTGEVMSVVFSPSGQQIALGSKDKTVRLWDAETGAPGAILEGHTGEVICVVFSPSGQQIASGSYDTTVRLWDAQTGAPGAILEGHSNSVTSVMFSPSGRQIASGSLDKMVRLWDAQTGAPGAILENHTSWVQSVVFSSSGQQIASGSLDKTVRLWDAETGAPGAILKGHSKGVRSVVFSPNGQQIASGSNDRTVRLWDAQTGAPGAILEGHTDEVNCVVFSPSGQQIASGGDDNAVRLWDAQTDAPGAILKGHTDGVTSVVFSPSGQQIASGSLDKTVRLWDAQTDAPGAILEGHSKGVQSVVFSPNGQQIASGSNDRTVRLWDAQTGAPGAILEGHTDEVNCVVFSPSGQQIASGSMDKTVRLWNAKSAQCLAIIKSFHNGVRSLSWIASVNGSYLTTGSDDMSVCLWQVIEDGSDYLVRLRWNCSPHRLTVSDTNIQNAQGLSRVYMKLLEQRGALGKPISPMSFRAAGEKVISTISVASRLSLLSTHSTLNTTPATVPSSVQPTKPAEITEISQFDCEEEEECDANKELATAS